MRYYLTWRDSAYGDLMEEDFATESEVVARINAIVGTNSEARIDSVFYGRIVELEPVTVIRSYRFKRG